MIYYEIYASNRSPCGMDRPAYSLTSQVRIRHRRENIESLIEDGIPPTGVTMCADSVTDSQF